MYPLQTCSNYKHTVDGTVDNKPHSQHPKAADSGLHRYFLTYLTTSENTQSPIFQKLLQLQLLHCVSVHKSQTTFHGSHRIPFYLTTKFALTLHWGSWSNISIWAISPLEHSHEAICTKKNPHAEHLKTKTFVFFQYKCDLMCYNWRGSSNHGNTVASSQRLSVRAVWRPTRHGERIL